MKTIRDYFDAYYEKNESYKNFTQMLCEASQVNREIYLGDIDEDLADNVEGLIRQWNRLDEMDGISVENRSPIKVYINSWGGSLIAAFTIIDAIKLSKTPIITINTGAAYSAGFFIFIAGHKRICYPHSSFLFHEGSINPGQNDAHKFRNQAEFYKTQLEQLKKHTIDSTSITEEKYEEIKRDDFWLTAQEALKLKVCDIIAEGFVS